LIIGRVTNEAKVPMFYRVVCEVPDPHFPDITAQQSLALLGIREGEDSFVILDVRTPGEYATRHVAGAVNIDYYSSTFAADLDALDKNKVYLIYCASGNRSGRAHDTMLSQGFHEVYNMLGGFGAFQALEGAGAFLEP
jgi:rhodanese-related sulfurtransferase